MTNQRETWRELLLELKEAAEFDESLAPDERAIAADDVQVDPLLEALGRRGVLARLACIAGELLPSAQRVHVGVDPLDLRTNLARRHANPLTVRREFGRCIDEMLRRLDFGYSARPPLAEDIFPGRVPASKAPIADGTAHTNPAVREPEAGREGLSDKDAAALAAFREHFAATNEQATWCKPVAAGDEAAPTRGAAHRPKRIPQRQRSTATAAHEIRSSEIEDANGQRVPPSTIQNWKNRGLQLEGRSTPTKLVVRRKMPGGECVFDRMDVDRFVTHSEHVKAEKGPAV